MKKLFILVFVVALSMSCKKTSVEASNTKPDELIALNGWQLSRYSDSSGKTIGNSSLNISAIALYGLIFEFRTDKETRALDKATKNIVNRGTWNLLAENSILDINISGFKGQFKLVSISKGKMILQASTGNFLSGVGAEINMEFVESIN